LSIIDDILKKPENGDVQLWIDENTAEIHACCPHCGVEIVVTAETAEELDAFPHEPWCIPVPPEDVGSV
jgi:hypothetical protein